MRNFLNRIEQNVLIVHFIGSNFKNHNSHIYFYYLNNTRYSTWYTDTLGIFDMKLLRLCKLFFFINNNKYNMKIILQNCIVYSEFNLNFVQPTRFIQKVRQFQLLIGLLVDAKETQSQRFKGQFYQSTNLYLWFTITICYIIAYMDSW